MKILRDIRRPPEAARGTVLALGNFDGLHLGHRTILNHCIALARAEGRPSAVMTFEPHPREFFSRDHAPMRIYPFRCKAALIAECGIDILFVAKFGKRLAVTAAESFIDDILHKNLGVRHVVTGYNFAFGKGRAGTTDMLSHRAQALEFGFTAHQPVHADGGEIISSSAIRALLSEGKMREAAAMLGAPYRVTGRVQKGKQRGKGLGFPTANLPLSGLLQPRFGIYAARMQVDGTWKNAAVSVGINPTFALLEPLLEAHCLEETGDLYGRRITVELIEFLRGEEKFEDVQLLQQQIKLDCEHARHILKIPSPLEGEG